MFGKKAESRGGPSASGVLSAAHVAEVIEQFYEPAFRAANRKVEQSRQVLAALKDAADCFRQVILQKEPDMLLDEAVLDAHEWLLRVMKTAEKSLVWEPADLEVKGDGQTPRGDQPAQSPG